MKLRHEQNAGIQRAPFWSATITEQAPQSPLVAAFFMFQ
jgi:hypothetical protein